MFGNHDFTRRQFLRSSAVGLVGATAALPTWQPLFAQQPGERPRQAKGVEVINPRGRVPVSFIIDDSTCLVNLAHFAIPQFREAFPKRYKQPWRTLPREIPDSFVRKFGEWCREQGIKGKYSVVPYPALVGWVDRDMPGWSRRELVESVKLVRDFMMPDWDIHPEMVSHTWAINTKTGRPYPTRTSDYMENWGFSVGMSVDQMADYVGYALKILKSAGLPCEGVTTPGGFGNSSLQPLAQGTLEAVRDVFEAEVPHYFSDLYTDERSVQPQVYCASGLESDDPRCVVSIIGCTGDWFGGWDGLTPGSADRFITEDLQGGRLPEVIDRGEPAVLVCHWPGIYYNGEEIGFNIFKTVVGRLHEKYDHLQWMKLSEIARYWAAKTLTTISQELDGVHFRAPFACPQFTVRMSRHLPAPRLTIGGQASTHVKLRKVKGPLQLESGTWCVDGEDLIVCFDLVKGEAVLGGV